MPIKRTSRPAKRAAGAARSRAPKKAVAAKAANKTKAVVVARKKTVDTVIRHEDVATLKVDPGDEAALAIIARRRPATRPTRTRRSAVDRLDDPPPATGTALIERVSRAIERELNQIEVIVGGHRVNKTQRTEGERRARTLASLARTLREVMALRAGEKKERREDDDAVPRDLSTLRLALARRLDQLVADAKAAHPEGAE